MAYTRVYITAIKIEAPITSVMECCFKSTVDMQMDIQRINEAMSNALCF